MKVTIENKKGLEKDLKVFVDKNTISGFMEEKYEEIRKDVVIKGFRPGKVPTEILKRQFGKAVYGEVIDKLLKTESPKLEEFLQIWKEKKLYFVKKTKKIVIIKQKISEDFEIIQFSNDRNLGFYKKKA